MTAAAGGVTYYVSPSGSDSDSGTSPSQAWQTVKQVDRADLKPGDVVLFQGGATFADQTLMPGWGTGASGTPTAPITFGSYGQGRAWLPLGVWFNGDDNLVFANLALGPSSGDSSTGGFQGTGNGITIEGLTISHVGLGVLSEGDNWKIVDNSISDTGDSGMLLGFDAGTPGDPPGGTGYLVSENTITQTGLNPALTFGTHGIYLKVADATVTDNTITHFNNDGISVRYRNNTITNNTISGGDIGLAWFQYDTQPGTSDWSNNTLSDLSTAGIYVCGTGQDCLQPLESFSITGNTIKRAAAALILERTSGSYSVSGNSLP
ncbi:MAG: right-handed parallel beta-helix repeat-containing protein [Solirubrobacteraceae bacterium]